MKESTQRLIKAFSKAWQFSQKHPLEAFCWGGVCLLFAWGAKIYLSLLAFSLMARAVATLLGQK